MARQGRAALAGLAAAAALLHIPATGMAAGPLPPFALAPAVTSGTASCGFLAGQPGVAGLDVATNARGDAIVSWTENAGGGNHVVRTAFRPAGGAFGPAETVGPTLPCYFLGILGPAPDVALAADGTAAVVYVADGAGGRDVIRAALRPSGGTFGAPVDLSDDAQAANSDPRLAMTPGGAAMAVWTRSNGANTIVQMSERAPGGAFSPEVDLSAGGQNASQARVALNAAGAAAVAWVRSNGTHTIAQTRVRPAGAGVFGPVRDLSAEAQNASAPDVAIDASGRATAVWVRSDGTQDRVQSRFLTPDGAIGAGVDDISDAGTNGSAPNLAVDPANTAVVVYGACPTGGGSCAVQSATRPSNGSFGPVETISPPSDNSVLPRVVIDDAGVATAVFSPFTTDAGILLTRRPAGGAFGGVQTISSGGGFAVFPATAVDGEGNVVAAWTFTILGSPNTHVAQATAFDAGAPTITAVSVPGTATTGQPVTMTAAAADRWATPSLSWSFGDAAGASGSEVSHAFGAAGAYTVAVTATDAVGNATTESRTVIVTDPPPPPPTPRIVSPVQTSFAVKGRTTLLLRLRAREVPAGAKLQLRCSGKKCPFKRRASNKIRNSRITLFKRVGTKKAAKQRARRFRAGQTLQVRVTAPGHIGKAVTFRLKKGKLPSGTTRCIPLGGGKPRTQC